MHNVTLLNTVKSTMERSLEIETPIFMLHARRQLQLDHLQPTRSWAIFTRQRFAHSGRVTNETEVDYFINCSCGTTPARLIASTMLYRDDQK